MTKDNIERTSIVLVTQMQHEKSTTEKEISGTKFPHVSKGFDSDKEPPANEYEKQMVIVTPTPSNGG